MTLLSFTILLILVVIVGKFFFKTILGISVILSLIYLFSPSNIRTELDKYSLIITKSIGTISMSNINKSISLSNDLSKNLVSKVDEFKKEKNIGNINLTNKTNTQGK